MGKPALVAPAYLSIAWTLMISYQLFTQTAVTTIVTSINTVLPSVGFWLSSRIDMVIFIYAFAWVFVLSSVIPSAILGKERSVLVQFLVCLSLTLSAFILLDALKNSYGAAVDQLLSFAYLLSHPLLAALYLAVPYIFMLSLDMRTRNKNKREKKRIEALTENYLRNAERADRQNKEAE